MPVTIPQLDSSCCGCTLKTGTKIIGWLQLIGGIILLVSFSIAFIALTAAEDQPNNLKISSSKELQQFTNQKSADGQKIDRKVAITILKILTAILIVISLVTCAMAFVLLMGVYQNKPKLVYGWVITSLWLTIISFILDIGRAHDNFSNLGGSLVSLIINLYCLLVVYSYYRTIRNQPSIA